MDRELHGVSFTDIEGWAAHDHDAALAVFQRSGKRILDQSVEGHREAQFGGSLSAWQDVARSAVMATGGRQFFETLFRPYRVYDPECPEGLFTGYFEPEAEGSLEPSDVYCVPIYRRPRDLVAFSDAVRRECGLSYGRIIAGQAAPYLTRREIEKGALEGLGLEIVWLKDWADAFFIHIQGSGRIRLREGGDIRLSYAAKSGLPYTSIGRVLAARGLLAHAQLSMQTIRAWMVQNPEEARALMWENQSFIFFQLAELEDAGLGALGAQHLQLTPRRSLAVDRKVWMLGTPVWLDTQVPTGDEVGMQRFQQLLIAQDTGSAIKGLARGDVYWGFGHEAARVAGPMKSPGQMHVLLPPPVAEELGLGP
jgi:membrane-bound lytic murein transglycosylase A